MDTEGNIKNSNRFSFLQSPTECSRPIYDQILFETQDCVVTPTLGSIVPNWILIVPRSPILNFANWAAATGRNPAQLVRDVISGCSLPADRIVWFEHGPSHKNSTLGCGVDQAHLHVIYDAPFSAEELRLQAKRMSKLDWTIQSADKSYGFICPDQSYLAVGSLDHAGTVQNVEHLGSQFLRRAIATLSDQHDSWNYRTHSHLQNVRETVRAFNAIAS